MRLTDYPLVLFVVAVIVLSASAKLGTKFAHYIEEVRDDFSTIMTATLTLLGLIVGFSFSMAVGRYDQRKNLEEEEANAIGTEYVRAELLPATDAQVVQRLLLEYLDQRISYYEARDRNALEEIGSAIARQQNKLWASLKGPPVANPSALTALVVAGMNNVLNSQGYTEAAWLNRIPRAAWFLLAIISICSNVMVGLSLHNSRSIRFLIVVLPFIVAVSLLLIADIDSPRSGLIHVRPENLISLARSLRT